MASIQHNANAPTDTTIRVVLVDDSGSVRRALRLMLSSEPDLCVIGEAADGEQAIHLAQNLHPDIILMDFELSGMSGLDATRHIKAAGEACAIVMLTAWSGDALRGAAAQAGVALFIEKGDHLDDLAGTLRVLHARNHRP